MCENCKFSLLFWIDLRRYFLFPKNFLGIISKNFLHIFFIWRIFQVIFWKEIFDMSKNFFKRQSQSFFSQEILSQSGSLEDFLTKPRDLQKLIIIRSFWKLFLEEFYWFFFFSPSKQISFMKKIPSFFFIFP